MIEIFDDRFANSNSVVFRKASPILRGSIVLLNMKYVTFSTVFISFEFHNKLSYIHYKLDKKKII